MSSIPNIVSNSQETHDIPIIVATKIYNMMNKSPDLDTLTYNMIADKVTEVKNEDKKNIKKFIRNMYEFLKTKPKKLTKPKSKLAKMKKVDTTVKFAPICKQPKGFKYTKNDSAPIIIDSREDASFEDRSNMYKKLREQGLSDKLAMAKVSVKREIVII